MSHPSQLLLLMNKRTAAKFPHYARTRAHTRRNLAGGTINLSMDAIDHRRTASSGRWAQNSSGNPGVTLRVRAVMETEADSLRQQRRAWVQPTCLQVQRDPRLVDVRRVALGADPPDRSAVDLLLRGCRHVRLAGQRSLASGENGRDPAPQQRSTRLSRRCRGGMMMERGRDRRETVGGREEERAREDRGRWEETRVEIERGRRSAQEAGR